MPQSHPLNAAARSTDSAVARAAGQLLAWLRPLKLLYFARHRLLVVFEFGVSPAKPGDVFGVGPRLIGNRGS